MRQRPWVSAAARSIAGFNGMDYETGDTSGYNAGERRSGARPRSRHPRRLRHDLRIQLMAFMAGLPAVAVALFFTWSGDYTPKVQWTLTVLMLGCWFGFAAATRERVVFPLQTLSNLLAALREGDYSIRARGAGREDALGEVMLEANALGETLREQRRGA